MVAGHPCRGRRPRRPAEGSRPLPTMRKISGWLWEACGPGMPGPYGVVDGWRVLAGRCGQAYCTIRIPDKHHSISKEVLLAPLSFFVVSCYNILCIVMYKIYRERYLFITYAAFEKL